VGWKRGRMALHWQTGHGTLDRQVKAEWGDGILDRIASDLRAAFPGMRGFSSTNLKYMRLFAQAWPYPEAIRQQAVDQMPWGQNVLPFSPVKGPKNRLFFASRVPPAGGAPVGAPPPKPLFGKRPQGPSGPCVFHLNRLVEKEKIFTESEITLTQLAARLNIHPNYLSQVINEKEETNFYDYINPLRIQEFKRLAALPENKKYTLLSLAFECGFNSKSSFNRYFKKVAGVSPSEYMRNV